MGKYETLAKDIVKNVGGKENVISLTHCITRLRFQLKDETLANTDVLKNMDGVVTVVQTAGQYQVVIGNHVTEVYKEVCAVSGISQNKEDVPKKKQKLFDRFLDLITGIFMPSIGILTASGILKGINIILAMTGLVAAESGLGQLFAAAADTMFMFFPIILGFNAFKKLGGDPYLGMVLGGALVYPAIQGVDLEVFGFTVNATYTSTVLPIVLLAFIAVPLEKWLNKVVPDLIKAFVVPSAVLLICVPLGFCLIGPAANALGYGINVVIQGIYKFSPILGGAVLGFIWQILVLVGCHALVYIPLLMGLLAGEAQPLMSVIGMTTFVQTGAVIAIWMKTKNKKLKEVALPAWVSGIFGVTEPAIYGVTLPNGKQFMLTCFGAGITGALAMVLGVSTYTVSGGGIFGIPARINPADPKRSLFLGILMNVISVVIGFVLAFITYKEKKETMQENKITEEKVVRECISENEIIVSPVSGIAKDLSEVEDAAFSQGVLGQGIAVEPIEGKIVSPVNGTVTTLFPTKHALGIMSEKGAEVLIHLGMNTVELNGKHFEAHVKEGDKVKTGDLLVTVDIEAVKADGYSMVTPIIITNTDDYKEVSEKAVGKVKAGEEIIECKK